MFLAMAFIHFKCQTVIQGQRPFKMLDMVYNIFNHFRIKLNPAALFEGGVLSVKKIQ